MAHREHVEQRVAREVDEAEVCPERPAVVGQLEIRVDEFAAVVATFLLVGHRVVEPREPLEVREIDVDLERLDVLVLRVVDAGLADLQEVFEVVVELRFGHGRHLV